MSTSTRNPNLEADFLPPSSTATSDDPLAGPRPEYWWTGKRPLQGECPGVDGEGILRSLPALNLKTVTRRELLDYFDNGWALTEVLFAALQGADAFYRPPYHRLRHPMIFYYAHPAALYVNKLQVAGLFDGPTNAYFERLFETGVDEMSWDDLSRGELDWPDVEAVTEYRRTVYRRVRALIESHPDVDERKFSADDPLWALFMALEHERIHLELSSVLIRELPLTHLARPRQWAPNHPSAREAHPSFAPREAEDYPANELIHLAAGTVRIGKPRSFPSYGWDNEYGERLADVRSFHSSKFLVSNGEFYEFVSGGGYVERRHWTEEGWGWRTFRNSKFPTFWVPDGPAGSHRFRLRALFETVSMPWNWPVEVNRHEALAYCAWRGEREGRKYRTLTEAEHHRLRGTPAPDAPEADPAFRTEGGENLSLRFGSPSPVDGSPATSAGAHDVFGNVWEWCMDEFHPLPGFRVHRYYDDFSTPCFDGHHHLVLGGSFISTGDEATAFARFQFRPHFFQHCGFRLSYSATESGDAVRARDEGSRVAGAGVYESAKMLDEYLLLHFGSEADTLTLPGAPPEALRFPQRCAQLALSAVRRLGAPNARALDIGCAVGGATFELARGFDEVLGVDLSASFIQAAEQLRGGGELPYFRRDEGELGRQLVARVDAGIDRDRVRFRRADAVALPAELEGFDAVLLANLLCRVPSPSAVLGRMGGPRGLVRPGGVLVIVSPYTWMEQFTPKEVWLGGFLREGNEVRSSDGLRAQLEPGFELLEELHMPLVIREHARKFQLIISHGTVWRRR